MVNDITVLLKLDHPHILKVFECYTDSKYFYVVTELCKGGELFDHLVANRTLSE